MSPGREKVLTKYSREAKDAGKARTAEKDSDTVGWNVEDEEDDEMEHLTHRPNTNEMDRDQSPMSTDLP